MYWANRENRENSLLKLNFLGFSGIQLNDTMFNGKSISRSNFTGDEIKIFDFYNTNKEGDNADILDENELNNMLQDLINADKKDFANKYGNKKDKKENLGYFLPVEMKEYIKQNWSGKNISVQALISFVQKIVNHCDIEDLTNKSKLNPEILLYVDDDNITTVFSDYQNKMQNSIITDLCKCKKSVRNNYLNLLKSKIIFFAEKCGINHTDFEREFDIALSKISGKRDTANIAILDNLVNDFVNKLKEKEDVYKANKDSIICMLSDSNLCYSREDLNKVVDDIMKYSNMYNPKKDLENLNIKNKKTKALVDSLLKSNLLDYFPVFVASLIAQESQFREQGDSVFSKNGKGVTQVTRSIINDMYTRPSLYDKDFIKKIQSDYPDSTKLYNAILESKNTELNYQTGIVGLKGKLIEAIRLHSNDKYKKLKITTPEMLLELMVMNYNSNEEPKKDPIYKNKLSQVRYVYARDVMLRLKKYLPKGNIKHYYEYNPNNKQWVYK